MENKPSSVLLFQFNDTGKYIVAGIVSTSEDQSSEISSYILCAMSSASHEDIADSLHSKLKNDQAMKVLGGGSLSIDHENFVIQTQDKSVEFGSVEKSLVEKILSSSFVDYKIKIN
eukprot:TRINITY_DN10511_c0_g1_i1.p1 TRINITY_DN10511_c0_g1~~TRINITY_DN10511_c0_g1_i1.p1  ORF type:complete len:116 (-),score=14.50 TRINITY_DN10511_c0_g1_i1:11-358(-)